MKEQRRRPPAINTLQAAALALELVEAYGVWPAKSAIAAAVESVRDNLGAHVTREAVERRYRELRRTGDGSQLIGRDKYQVALISDGAARDALSRLPRRARRHSLAPPATQYVIALARLFDRLG